MLTTEAAIAWERFMRETEHAAASNIRRRLGGAVLLYKHLVRHGHVRAPRSARSSGRRSILTRLDPRLREGAGAQTARYAVRIDRRACAMAGSCRSLQVGLRRAEIAALRLATCTNRGHARCGSCARVGGATRWRSTTDSGSLRAYLDSAGHGADNDGPVVPTARTQASVDEERRHGPRRDRPRGPQICRRARARSRLLGALDARDVHHHRA